MGEFSEPPVGSKGFNLIRDALDSSVNSGFLHISFESAVADGKVFLWQAIMLGRKLFLEAPDGVMTGSSKESFVAILEYAESTLQCDQVIICFKKDRPDKASLIRNFMFLGFVLLPPGHRLVPAASGAIVYMAYMIDDPGEE